jgi:hypothetical protein
VRAAAKGVKMPRSSFDRAADSPHRATALIAGARNHLFPLIVAPKCLIFELKTGKELIK